MAGCAYSVTSRRAKIIEHGDSCSNVCSPTERHNWSFPMSGFGRTEGKELRFDLTDMRLFVTVVEQGSLTKGAEKMNLALTSVSERISGMESSLGAQLLDRNRRGVTHTAADHDPT